MFTAFANLGVMYAQAQGVPQDLIQAHMWFHLAAANGDEGSAERCDILAIKMTPAQIAEAQERARGVEANEQITRLETPQPLRYCPPH